MNPLPDAVIVTGDIANSGDPREHELALSLLEPLPMPVHRLAGNHDLFEERTRYAFSAGGVRVVACDTSIPGRDDGTLELDWLAAQLAEDRETPTIVAMHHPPLVTGLGGWTRSASRSPTAPRSPSSCSPHPTSKRVVGGHVHRVIHATLGGCGVITCTSTNIQSGPTSWPPRWS